MNKLSIINQIIEERYKPQNQNCLIEEDRDEKGKQFKVEYPIVKSSQNIDFILYRFSNNDFPFFREVSDLKKMCDYILFVEENNNLTVFTIELKLSNYSGLKQLNAANVFVDFIVNSATRVGAEINDYQVKKIRICESKISKKNNFIKVEDKYKFDKDNFLDYQVSKSFLLGHLL